MKSKAKPSYLRLFTQTKNVNSCLREREEMSSEAGPYRNKLPGAISSLPQDIGCPLGTAKRERCCEVVSSSREATGTSRGLHPGGFTPWRTSVPINPTPCNTALLRHCHARLSSSAWLKTLRDLGKHMEKKSALLNCSHLVPDLFLDNITGSQSQVIHERSSRGADH